MTSLSAEIYGHLILSPVRSVARAILRRELASAYSLDLGYICVVLV